MPARSPLKSPARPRRARTEPNNVRRLREAQLLTKAELARMAGISALTLARIEGGHHCRVDTQRKIILALGLKPSDRAKVFGDARRLRLVRAG
jgi:transcriptional regulator with XRE-family HTH domain